MSTLFDINEHRAQPHLPVMTSKRMSLRSLCNRTKVGLFLSNLEEIIPDLAISNTCVKNRIYSDHLIIKHTDKYTQDYTRKKNGEQKISKYIGLDNFSDSRVKLRKKSGTHTHSHQAYIFCFISFA